jgi:putative ABC transport system permease protein
MLTDLRFAFRLLLKQPGFSAVAVLTMAIAIGANTALFSVVNAVVLRPIDFPRPDELVRVWAVNPARNIEFPAVSWPRYLYFRDHATKLANVALSVGNAVTITDGRDAEQVPNLMATSNFFATLGLTPKLGRFVDADEDHTGGPNVALISQRLWQTRFGGAPDVINKQITIDGVPTTIIGVLPTMPVPFNQVEIVNPRPLEVPFLTPQARDGGAAVWQLTARLQPGVTREAAEKELGRLNAEVAAQNPQLIDAQNPLQLRFFANEIIPPPLRLGSWILVAAVIAVLLIACANIANLSLSRLASRTKEIAVRASLGAGRRAIIQQFLTESFVMAGLGGALGVLLASWSLDGIRLLGAQQLPRIEHVAIDGAALGFAFGATVLATLLVGFYPAWLATRANVQMVLKESGRGTTGGSANKRFRNLLVVVEVAASVVLLIGAALLLYSFARLQRTQLGFDPARVAVGTINLPLQAYPTPEKQRQFVRQLQEKLDAAPELAAGGAGFGMPLTNAIALTPYSVSGQPIQPIAERRLVTIRQVSPGFFAAIGATLKEGRWISPRDEENGPAVAVLNETFAKQVFPEGSAVGKTLLFGRDGEKKCEIVGVMHDVKSAGISAPVTGEIYFAHAQRGGGFITVIGKAKAGLDAAAVIPVLRRVVRDLDPNIAVATPQTADELVGQDLQGLRALSLLLGAFAALAGILATVGIYSIIACNVTQRTAEIGVRIALGASAPDIFRLVLKSAGALIGIGLIIGLGVAGGTSQVLRQLLFEVQPFDPVIFALVAAAFAVVGCIAAVIPARRATLVDPLIALRAE